MPSNYKQPTTNIPQSMAATNSQQKTLAQLPYVAWWQKFNDPTLNVLIESAITNNNELQIAAKNIEIAQAQLNTIKLSWIPGVNFFAGFSQNPNFANPGVFYGIQPTYITNLFTTYYQQQQAKYNLERVQILQSGVKLTVISQVVAAYFSLLAYQDRLSILKDKEHDYQQLLTITRSAQSLGLTNNLQITRLQSQIFTLDGEIANVKKNIIASANAIRYLTNQVPGAIATNKTLDELNGEILVFDKINVKVIANRPDVMSAVKNIAVAGSGINVSASQLLPSLYLDEFVGQASLNGSVSAPNQGVSFGDAYTMLNLSPATFGNINTNKAIFRREVANYNRIVQNALREIANSINANKQLTNKYHDDTEALQAMIKNDDLLHHKYDSGLVSKITLLDSKIAVNDSKLILNISKLEQLISVVMLYQQLAGGYGYDASSSHQVIQAHKS